MCWISAIGEYWFVCGKSNQFHPHRCSAIIASVYEEKINDSVENAAVQAPQCSCMVVEINGVIFHDYYQAW